ncbi:MAG: extensin family protein [Pseudomonadota bacterium]
MMKPALLLLPAFALVAAATLPAEAQRGPIARKIIALGSNVALPSFRPAPETVTKDAQGALANPLDRVKPETLTYAGAPKPIIVEPRTLANPKDGPATAKPDMTPDTEPARTVAQTCMAQLIKIARAKTAPSPKADDAACVVENPVELLATRGNTIITFPPGLVLDCPFALAFARFSTDVAQPLARFHLGQDLTRITTGPGFTCRRRNNQPTGKLSQHAFGNAVDIASFTLADNSKFAVQPSQALTAQRAKFQRTLRQTACGSFTTILGPGSDGFHEDHIHFDLGRSDKENPYRICQ